MPQDNRGIGRFNNGLYEAAKQAALDAGAPEAVAEKSARVVAKDDPTQDNLGRTDEDQDAVWQAWIYFITGGPHD
jgi:hypothetical protein